MMWTHFIMAASGLGALAVILGAFGAHGLRDKLSPEYLAVFETAVRYQMYHALALLAVALVATRIEVNLLKLAGFGFILGTVLFSGSLYVLTLSGIKAFGAVTPVGGLVLVGAWIALGVSMLSIQIP